MATPAVERMLWRFDAYSRICQACAQSQISMSKFLVFRPEKMRIRIGESLQRTQVPVVFAPDLADRMGALLPASVAAPAPTAPPTRDTLRRSIALAQLDGDLDVFEAAHFTSGSPSSADRFLDTFTQLYGRLFDEARASGSGEETAALFQLVAMSSLRNVLLHKIGASDRFLGLGALLAHLCDRALGATVERAADGLSGRLGLLMMASCSPLSLMGAAPSVAQRPGNAYRTLPSAFLRARDILRGDHMMGFDLWAARASITADLLTDPQKKRDLVRSVLAEAVRDLALLSTLTQGSELRDLAGQSSALAAALFSPGGPETLRTRLQRHPRAGEEPLVRMQILVDSVGAVLAGDHDAVAKMGSIEERADIAAAGALVLAFDELALEQGGYALQMVRPVPPGEAAQARAEGKAYFFGLDDEPLYALPKQRDEAFLFADMKDFTKRTQAIREDSMGEFLRQYFYEPILRTCGHLGRIPEARVSVVNLLGDAVACRGDVSSMVAVALSVRHILDEAARELDVAARALTASGDEILKEIDLELKRVEVRLQAPSLEGPLRSELERHHAELLQGRAERVTKTIGAGLEAGVFVTYGREASVIEVGGPEVGEWRVVIAEQLNAAARGTGRSGKLTEARAAHRASDEKKAGRPLEDPFFVHCSADPLMVTATTDFHNAGSALSGEALAAFQNESAGRLVFRPMTIPRTSLPPRLQRYWLPRTTEEFLLASDNTGAPGILFRFSGKTIFRGLEANGAVDIWEICLVDRGFGRDFVDALRQS